MLNCDTRFKKKCIILVDLIFINNVVCIPLLMVRDGSSLYLAIQGMKIAILGDEPFKVRLT
jgi:hypothetical protein